MRKIYLLVFLAILISTVAFGYSVFVKQKINMPELGGFSNPFSNPQQYSHWDDDGTYITPYNSRTVKLYGFQPVTDNLYDIGSSSTQWRYGNFQQGLLIADGSTTGTLLKDSLTLGQTANFNQGKFFVDSSGNWGASGTFGYHLIPSADLTWNLGSASARLLGLYAGTLNLTGVATNPLVVGDGSTSSTLTKNSFNVAQTSTVGAGKFSVDLSGNVSSSGTLTVYAGSSSVTSTIYTDLLVSNAASFVTSTGIVTIPTLETSVFDLTADGGIMSWIDMDVTTTTPAIEMSYVATIDDFGYLKLLSATDGYGSIKTTSTMAVGLLSGFDWGGTYDMGGLNFSVGTSTSNSLTYVNVLQFPTQASSTMYLDCQVIGASQSNTANFETNKLTAVLQTNSSNGLVFLNDALTQIGSTSTWRASSTFSGGVLGITARSETGSGIVNWRSSCAWSQIIY